MKYTFGKKLIVLNILVLTLWSCSKNDSARRDPPTPSEPPHILSQLQHAWIVDSIDVYPDSAFSGQRFPGIVGNGSDFFHFSPNGKLYSVVIGSIDSANYYLHPDSTIYVNQYYGGVATLTPDTLSIRVLTNTKLILARRNEAGDWGKFTFRR